MANILPAMIPEIFIHEYLNGQPLYYRNYKKIKADPDKLEGLKGTSGIHSILVTGLLDTLMDDRLREECWVCPGRPGLRLDADNIFCIDLAVVAKKIFPSTAISNDLLNVPPELTVEIDIAIENKQFSKKDYINHKVQHLLRFGTKRVIWVFLNEKRVLIAEPGNAVRNLSFADDFELMNGIVFNISRFAQSKSLIHLRYD